MNETGNDAAFCAKPVPTCLHIPIDGYVYFATDGTAIKIGYSGAPPVRFKTLRSLVGRDVWGLAIFKGTTDDEKALHRHFARLRLHHEWFALSSEITKMIAKIKECGGCIMEGLMRGTIEVGSQVEWTDRGRSNLRRRQGDRVGTVTWIKEWPGAESSVGVVFPDRKGEDIAFISELRVVQP